VTDPNITYSGLSREVQVDGSDLQIEIYRLEHRKYWTLEIIDEKGTSTVWDDSFGTDQEALDEAQKTILKEGIGAFHDSGNVIPFPKR
jgi:hypothetical protein